MEEITWLIWKILMMDLSSPNLKKIFEENPAFEDRKTSIKTLIRVIMSLLSVVLFMITGWIIQNYFKIEIDDKKIEQISNIIASSFIALVAFVGVMVIFGFQRVDCKKARIEDKLCKNSLQLQKKYDDLSEGERLARYLMLKFSVYTFFLIVINLFLLVFSSEIPSKFALPILFGDISLAGYSFKLVIGIAGKILDT